MELLLTVEQTAGRLQMHPVSVRRLLARGEIRGVKRGRVWRIPESALSEQTKQAPANWNENQQLDAGMESPLNRALALVEASEAKSGMRSTPAQKSNAAALLREAREGRTAQLMNSTKPKPRRARSTPGGSAH